MARYINKTTELSCLQMDTCIAQEESGLYDTTFREFHTFINRIRGAKHKSILEFKKPKLTRL